MEKKVRYPAQFALFLMAYYVTNSVYQGYLTVYFKNALHFNATQIGTMMMGIAGLSFLGFGVMEPQAEWGSMISQGRAYLQLNPWPVLVPAAATVLSVMLFNYLGDCVRDYFDVEAAA